MRCRGIRAVLLVTTLLAGDAGLCQQPQPTEYALKAAFLYNFAKFTEWPSNNLTGPLVFGVLGTNPFGDQLEHTLKGKTLDGRPLLIVHFESAAEASTNCHVLFISSSERRRLPEILAGLDGASILTVSEMEQFTEAGGMIRFLWGGERKIRFQINAEAAKRAGLKIRSKLINLAEPLEKGSPAR